MANATVLEWLRSPIVYRGDPAFRDVLLDLADRTGEPELLARHYLHLGRQQWDRLGAASPEATVRLKGVFYALRPAAVLSWMTANPTQAVPPMRLRDLLAQSGPSADLVDAVDELVAVKARTREVGTGPIPPPIRMFILDQLTRTDLDGSGERRLTLDTARALAADTFRALLRRGSGSTRAVD